MPRQILTDIPPISENDGVGQGVAEQLDGGCYLVAVARHEQQSHQLTRAIDHCVDLAVAATLRLSEPLFRRADAFVDELAICRELGEKGARLILSACAWAVAPDHDNEADPYGQLWVDSYVPVAREFELWIAGVSCVGKIRSSEWAGHHCIGSSMLVGPDGEIVSRAPFGRDAEALILTEMSRG